MPTLFRILSYIGFRGLSGVEYRIGAIAFFKERRELLRSCKRKYFLLGRRRNIEAIFQ